MALLHFGIGLFTELGRAIGTYLPAPAALFAAKAGVAIDNHNPVRVPFANGLSRALRDAGGGTTVITGRGQKAHRDIRILTFF